MCIKILDEEIKLLNPDFVIFLTSNWEWFYNSHIGLNVENIKFYEWGKFKTYYQKKNGITYIQSQHPQGKPESAHVDVLTKIIKESMAIETTNDSKLTKPIDRRES